ncbi:hypothetical protein ABK040_009049 [Willaertia magna]
MSSNNHHSDDNHFIPKTKNKQQIVMHRMFFMRFHYTLLNLQNNLQNTLQNNSIYGLLFGKEINDKILIDDFQIGINNLQNNNLLQNKNVIGYFIYKLPIIVNKEENNKFNLLTFNEYNLMNELYQLFNNNNTSLNTTLQNNNYLNQLNNNTSLQHSFQIVAIFQTIYSTIDSSIIEFNYQFQKIEFNPYYSLFLQNNFILPYILNSNSPLSVEIINLISTNKNLQYKKNKDNCKDNNRMDTSDGGINNSSNSYNNNNGESNAFLDGLCKSSDQLCKSSDQLVQQLEQFCNQSISELYTIAKQLKE